METLFPALVAISILLTTPTINGNRIQQSDKENEVRPWRREGNHLRQDPWNLTSDPYFGQDSVPDCHCCQSKPRPVPSPAWRTNFVSTPIFVDVHGRKKVFLQPVAANKKKGDWYDNKDLCREYGLDMVAIRSKEENDYFHTWARSPSVGLAHPGCWLGAQIYFRNQVFFWNDYYGGERTFSGPFSPGEPNEDGITCMWDGQGPMCGGIFHVRV